MLHNSDFYARLMQRRRSPKSGPIVSNDRIERKSLKRDLKRNDREKACAKQIITLPAKGRELVLILTGAWNGWDLVPTVISLSGKRIEHLRIATLGFNDRQTDSLQTMQVNGQISRCSMVVSEMFAAKSTREFANLQTAMTAPNRLSRSRNHAKLICFELEGGTKMACHGSLNLRTCRCFEQLVIANDPELHDFFASYIEDLLTANA